MFALTREEKRVVCFVVLAIIVGLGVKDYRRHRTLAPAFRESSHVVASVTLPPESSPASRRAPDASSLDSQQSATATRRARRSRKPRSPAPSPSAEQVNQESTRDSPPD